MGKNQKRTKKFQQKGGVQDEIARRRKRQKLNQRTRLVKARRKEKAMDRDQTRSHKNGGAPTSLMAGQGDQRRGGRAAARDESEEEEEEDSSEDERAAAMVAGVRSAQAASVDDLFGSGSGAPSAPSAAPKVEELESEEEEDDDDEMDVEAHRKQLEALAQTDPEFHKFLAENDEGTLAFGEGGSDEDDEMAARIAAAALEGEDAEADAGEDGGVLLTSAKFRAIAKQALEKKTLKGLQNLLHAFHAAVRELDSFAMKGGQKGGKRKRRKKDGEDEDDAGPSFNARYRILSNGVFDSVVTTTLGSIHVALEHHLRWSPAEMASTSATPRLPSDSKQWRRLRPCVVSLLRSMLRLLLEMSQSGIVVAVVSNLHTLLPFIACLIVADDASNPEERKHARLVQKLLKVLVERWAKGGSGIVTDKATAQADVALRTHCFNRIREFAVCAITLGASRVAKRQNGAVAKKLTDEFVELCLKQSYLAFVSAARTMNVATEGTVLLLRNCLCELYASLDLGLAYQLAFVYIRQLALYLRKAVVNRPGKGKKGGKETRHQKSQSEAAAQDAKKVYTWQYVNCLKFWAQLLSDAETSAALKPLVYPLVQIILGVLELCPAGGMRLTPLRFHCAEMLQMIEESSFVIAHDGASASLHARGGDVLTAGSTATAAGGDDARALYIPLSPLLLQVLHLGEVRKKQLAPPARTKPPALDTLLTLPKQVLRAKIVQDKIISRTLELLKVHLELHRYDIGFPEMVYPVVVQLRQFVKTTHVSEWRDAVRHMIAALEKSAKKVREAREDVEFGPSDTSAVIAFLWDEKAALAGRCALERRRKSLALIMTAKAAAESGFKNAQKFSAESIARDEESDEEVEEEDGRDEEVEEDSSADEESGAERRRPKTKRRHRSDEMGGDEDDDIVEELMLSDDDDDVAAPRGGKKRVSSADLREIAALAAAAAGAAEPAKKKKKKKKKSRK